MIKEAKKLTILSIGPKDEHHSVLAGIVRRMNVLACSSVENSLTLLRENDVPVVLCDSEYDWRGLLDLLGEFPNPPFLIVTSRLADDRLWSEALNLGAYDVLAKPFDKTEVTRVVTMACNRWSGRSTGSFRLPQCHELTAPAYA